MTNLDVVLERFEAPDDERVVEMRPGQLFHIPAVPHDSWVVGNERYVSLHFMGADHYARK